MTGPDRLAWTSWPIRDGWPRSLLLPAIVLGFSVVCGWGFGGAGWGLVSFAALGLATRAYFVPTAYVLDATGAAVKSLGVARQRPWTEVRNRYHHPDGVFLSPFRRPSRLDSFRGLYLRYRGNRAEVEAFLERHLGPARAADGH